MSMGQYLSRIWWVGVVSTALVLPLSLRLVWEMTYLTWKNGPQMIGFSLAHTFPILILLGAVSWIFSAVWLVGMAGATALRKTSLTKEKAALLIGVASVLVAPVLPYEFWQWTTAAIFGPTPVR